MWRKDLVSGSAYSPGPALAVSEDASMQPITLRDIVVQAGPERFGEIPTSQRPSAIQRTHTAHDTVSSRRIVVPRAWWRPDRHVTSYL